LGLSLAKRIIEEYHSGKIFVKKSEVDKGTTFTIKLPKKKEVTPLKSEPEKVLGMVQ
jgi:signal transduction histidine kinase